jgi:hypothetical protein
MPSPRAAARLAGSSYVVLFVLGIFGNFFVRERLVETGDAASTFANIADAQGLIRLAIVAFLGAFALDVVVAWALYHVFRPAGDAIAALAAWFRIVYTVFLGVAVVFLFAVLELTDGHGDGAVLELGDREAHALLALDAFNATWLVGLTCFGVHLALLGALSLRSTIAPRGLGFVLCLAGAAYVFDTIAYSLLSSYTDHEAIFTGIVAIPALIAEGWLMIWLLRSAGRESSEHEAAVPSATFAAASTP